MKIKSFNVFLYILLTGFFISPQITQAQSTRSLYFMDNAPIRLNLNPALQPMRGYFNIPVIGNIGTTIVSNPLSVQDFIDILDEKNDFLNNEKLFNKLENQNQVSMDLHTDIISFGFYAGKGFWSVNIGTKIMMSASIPKSMFEFARDADHFEIQDLINADYRVKDLQVNADVLTELGVGYSRQINEKLTVGGRFKFLVGIANLDAHVNEMSIRADQNQLLWQVETHGAMKISMKGLDLGTNENGGYIDDFDFDTPGVGGYGFGIDLGGSYNLIEDLTLSAAILDLGCVNWSKSSTTLASANGSHTYDAADIVDGSAIFNYDLIQFEQETIQKKRTTSLRPTLNIGAEYTFLDKKLGVGILSSTRFQKPENFSELTLSANYHPRNWFGASLSYSFLHSDFKTFGLGLKLGPVLLATDYMMTGDFKSVSRANAYMGISIPIGKRKSSQEQLTTFE